MERPFAGELGRIGAFADGVVVFGAGQKLYPHARDCAQLRRERRASPIYELGEGQLPSAPLPYVKAVARAGGLYGGQGFVKSERRVKETA